MSRILLLLAHRENRHLLAEWLSAHHKILLPEPGQPWPPFDLCILDGPSLDHHADWVQKAKQAAHPIFLPFLLVTHRHGVGLATQHLWESVDELIIGPIEKPELQARVETLLRVRRLSLENATLTRRLEEELAQAGAVQARLLPRTVPVLPGMELAARCVPALEVGGDFYDWLELAPGVTTLTLGDVMGKGMAAALLMATARASLRAVAPCNPPAAALEMVHRALQTDLDHTDSFITLFHAHVDAAARCIRYVDAGHGHSFLRRAGGAVEALRIGGVPVGFPESEAYEEGRVVLQPGDALVVYSDGLVAACAHGNVEQTALAEELKGANSAADMVERLIAYAGLCGPPPDDLTVMVLRCNAEP
jgi:phosphoserine phosphatase RsbU/P